jgi:hypothetical protein
MTSSGFEPANFRLVVYRLNQQRYSKLQFGNCISLVDFFADITIIITRSRLFKFSCIVLQDFLCYTYRYVSLVKPYYIRSKVIYSLQKYESFRILVTL